MTPVSNYTPFLESGQIQLALAAGLDVPVPFNPASSGWGFDYKTLAVAGMSRSGMNPTIGQAAENQRLAMMVDRMQQYINRNDRRVEGMRQQLMQYLDPKQRKALDQMSTPRAREFLGGLINNTGLSSLVGGSLHSMNLAAMAMSSNSTTQFAMANRLTGATAENLQFSTATALVDNLDEYFTDTNGRLRLDRTGGIRDRDRMGDIAAMVADAGAFDTTQLQRLVMDSGRLTTKLDKNATDQIRKVLENTYKMVGNLQDLYGNIGDAQLIQLSSRITGQSLDSATSIERAGTLIQQHRKMARIMGYDEKRYMDVAAASVSMMTALGYDREMAGQMTGMMMTQTDALGRYDPSSGKTRAEFIAGQGAGQFIMLNKDRVGRRLTTAMYANLRGELSDTAYREIVDLYKTGGIENEERINEIFKKDTDTSFDYYENRNAKVGITHANMLKELSDEQRLEASRITDTNIARRTQIRFFDENKQLDYLARDLAEDTGQEYSDVRASLTDNMRSFFGGSLLSDREEAFLFTDEMRAVTREDPEKAKKMLVDEMVKSGYKKAEVDQVTESWDALLETYDGNASRMISDLYTQRRHLQEDPAYSRVIGAHKRRQLDYKKNAMSISAGSLDGYRMGEKKGFLEELTTAVLLGKAKDEQRAWYADHTAGRIKTIETSLTAPVEGNELETFQKAAKATEGFGTVFGVERREGEHIREYTARVQQAMLTSGAFEGSEELQGMIRDLDVEGISKKSGTALQAYFNLMNSAGFMDRVQMHAAGNNIRSYKLEGANGEVVYDFALGGEGAEVNEAAALKAREILAGSDDSGMDDLLKADKIYGAWRSAVGKRGKVKRESLLKLMRENPELVDEIPELQKLKQFYDEGEFELGDDFFKYYARNYVRLKDIQKAQLNIGDTLITERQAVTDAEQALADLEGKDISSMSREERTAHNERGKVLEAEVAAAQLEFDKAKETYTQPDVKIDKAREILKIAREKLADYQKDYDTSTMSREERTVHNERGKVLEAEVAAAQLEFDKVKETYTQSDVKIDKAREILKIAREKLADYQKYYDTSTMSRQEKREHRKRLNLLRSEVSEAEEALDTKTTETIKTYGKILTKDKGLPFFKKTSEEARQLTEWMAQLSGGEDKVLSKEESDAVIASMKGWEGDSAHMSDLLEKLHTRSEELDETDPEQARSLKTKVDLAKEAIFGEKTDYAQPHLKDGTTKQIGLEVSQALAPLFESIKTGGQVLTKDGQTVYTFNFNR
jgi:hypothetical protein